MMIDQYDPLQFIESQIAGLMRFNRKTEHVLGNMSNKGTVRLETGDTLDSWHCLWIMGSAYCTYQGQGVGAREAVLNCLEKAKEALGENNGQT